jgi:hypothetical protein
LSYRSQLIHQLPCLACVQENLSVQCGKTEEHHLNLGGRAGQKRLGDDYSVPLGEWHHRGQPPEGMTVTEATKLYGPSLAKSSRKFRQRYGRDIELLERTNLQLETL